MEETSEEYFFSGKLHSEGIKLFLEQELLCCCPVSLFESSGHYDYECHDWWFSILSFTNLCKSNHAKVCSPSQVSIDKCACKCKAMVPFKQPHFALGQCQELTIRPHAFELNLPKSNPEKVWTSSQVSLHKQAFKAMTPGNEARQ